MWTLPGPYPILGPSVKRQAQRAKHQQSTKTMDSRSAEQIEESTEKLLHDLKAVVRDGEELLKAGAKDLGEKGMAARDRLAAAVQTARETGRKLEEQAVAGVKAAERLIRQHPYESIGIAFGIGMVIGALVNRR